MIELPVKHLLHLRGVKNLNATLRRVGFSPAVVQKILEGRQRALKLKHIEKLCTVLRCTPNDIFAWTPDQPADDYPENPLQAIRKKDLPKMDAVMGKLSLEEVKKRLGEGN